MTDDDLMSLAIQEAAKSQPGRDTDPLVGAVLAKGDELPQAAHRGQLAPGDHAEFTLLQKILRSRDLTKGGTLYTTLEPCTERAHDKRTCVQWIVDKGIKRVVIGILDPNPAICGRGYWQLLEKNIEVEFFPFELAQQIMELNQRFIDYHLRSEFATPALAHAIHRAKETRIAPYAGPGWGPNLALQVCPNAREGWPLDSVQLRLCSKEPYTLPEKHKGPYEKYFTRFYDAKKFSDDGTKFLLDTNPIAFSDAPSLRLDLRATRYSQVQFYRDEIASVGAESEPLIEDLIRGSLKARFPHAFCMHMIVATSDSKLLLTRRSPKIAYYPGTWSLSVEEQLSPVDLENYSGPKKLDHDFESNPW